MKTVMVRDNSKLPFKLSKNKVYSVEAVVGDCLIIRNDENNVVAYDHRYFKPAVNIKYNIGDVVDLSYIRNHRPYRIRIEEIDRDDVIYKVLSEQTGTITEMTQSYINDRKCRMTADVYRLKITKDRMANGWRFCGNRTVKGTKSLVEQLENDPLIRCVAVFEGRNGHGIELSNCYGIWILYHNTIWTKDEIMMAR